MWRLDFKLHSEMSQLVLKQNACLVPVDCVILYANEKLTHNLSFNLANLTAAFTAMCSPSMICRALFAYYDSPLLIQQYNLEICNF